MAYYSEEFIEEIKSSNDIVDVVSSYVNLKRQGTNYFGCCPFHKEKTPSFSVAPEKQIFHCFGCGQGGNVITFIMKIENLAFQEAVEFLADRAKLELPATDAATQDAEEEFKLKEYHKSVIYSINKDAGKFFHQNIYSSKMAQDYLTKRKLDITTVRKFGIGFAKDDNGLCKFLKEKGYKEQDVLASGLVGKSKTGIYYDKFKNRLMFPIFDIRGRVVAFGGRTLVSDKEQKENHIPKYVNSPENLAYTKGRHLYGLNLAKNAQDKLKNIIVVEGYMDVVSPVSKGVTNIVASLGTALTENQGKLLRKYTDEVILSYDSDSAGQSAILRGIEVLQNLNVSCKVLQMEGAKDPDEYVLKYGPEKFNALVEKSMTAIEYKINMLKKNYNLQDTNQKIRFLTKTAEVLSKISNNIERDIYVEKVSKEIGVGKEALNAEIEKILFKEQDKKIINFSAAKNGIENSYVETPKTKEEETVLYLLMLKDKKVFEDVTSEIKEEDITNSVLKCLYTKIVNAYNENRIDDLFDFTSICETDTERSVVTKLLYKQDTSNYCEKIVESVIQSFKVGKFEKRRKELFALINSTEDVELKAKYQSELSDLIKLMKN